jgi:hypothetical protein
MISSAAKSRTLARAVTSLTARSSGMGSVEIANFRVRFQSSAAVVDESDSPASFSPDKMIDDARYKATTEVPESLLRSDGASSQFNISGNFREGRAAYLDLQATTPLDPRVLDTMLPYMVSQIL